jgi:hypothetical protein
MAKAGTESEVKGLNGLGRHLTNSPNEHKTLRGTGK